MAAGRNAAATANPTLRRAASVFSTSRTDIYAFSKLCINSTIDRWYSTGMEETTIGEGLLADSLAFRLTVLGSTMQKEFAHHLKEAGLTPKHLGVLNVVDRALARTQDDVATLMQVTPGMVVRLVDHLEERELLRRQRDPANRRRHILTVTDRGAQVLASSAAFAATLDAQLISTTGPALAARLDKALATLMRTLTEPR